MPEKENECKICCVVCMNVKKNQNENVQWTQCDECYVQAHSSSVPDHIRKRINTSEQKL